MSKTPVPSGSEGKTMKEFRPDWEELANEHPECRCFIEFAYENYEQFQKYLRDTIKAFVKKVEA